MGWLRRSRLGNERGQSMVEMALVLPLLLALVMGIIEFGNLYATKIELNNLARHSVRVAIVAQDVTTEADDALEATLKARMPGSDVEITRSGSDVTAKAKYDAPLITGYIIGTGTKYLEAIVTMKAE